MQSYVTTTGNSYQAVGHMYTCVLLGKIYGVYRCVASYADSLRLVAYPSTKACVTPFAAFQQPRFVSSGSSHTCHSHMILGQHPHICLVLKGPLDQKLVQSAHELRAPVTLFVLHLSHTSCSEKVSLLTIVACLNH